MKKLLLAIATLGMFISNAGLPLQLSQFSVNPTDNCDDPVNAALFTIGVSGGTAPYDYFVDGNLIVSNFGPILATAVNSAAHTLEVVDSSVPDEQLITIDVGTTVSPFESISFTLDTSCFGIILNYNSTMRAGKNFDSVLLTADNGFNDQRFTQVGSFPGLAPGTYTIFFKAINDPNNVPCSQPLVVVFKITQAPLSISAVSNSIKCSSKRNEGSVTVTSEGGTPPFTYSINGPSGSQFTLPSSARSVTFTGLRNGNYTVEVIDSAGCTQSTEVRVKNRTCRPLFFIACDCKKKQ